VSAAAAALLAAALRRAARRDAAVPVPAAAVPLELEPLEPAVPVELDEPLPDDMSLPLLPVDPLMPVPVPPAGGLSLGPKPMFIAWSKADALFAELNFFAQVAIARRVCGP
jgi:hypothetical protein